MNVPAARGPISGVVRDCLTSGRELVSPPGVDAGVIGDEDAQLALWLLYELHYRGFDDAPVDREWDPALLHLRRTIEHQFEAELRTATHAIVTGVPDTGDVGQELLDLAERPDGPRVAAFLQREASLGQLRDYLRERSVQQLKESDPHSFVLGRLEGPAKVALAELQYDEYGAGRPARLHSRLYAQALAGADLDAAYGAYVDDVSALTLASANAMSMFAFHRRLRGAAMGHLAAFEATSSVPCRKIAMGIERVGLPEVVGAYFIEHVEADAVHEQVAARDICAAMVRAERALRAEVLFGAATCLHLDGLTGAEFLQRWTRVPEVVA